MQRYQRQFDLRRANVVPLRTRCFHVVLLFCFCAGLLVGPVTDVALSEESPPARLGTSQQTTFVSPGRFVWNQVVTPIISRGEQLALARPFDLPRRSRVSRAHRPLRQFVFVGGDRVSAELLQWGNDSVSLRLTGGHIVSVPQTCLAAIAMPPGESELIAKSFETDVGLRNLIAETTYSRESIDSHHVASGARSLKLSPATEPLTVTSHLATKSVRVQFWFRIERDISDQDFRSLGDFGSLSNAVSNQANPAERKLALGSMSFHFDLPHADNTFALSLDGARLTVAEHPRHTGSGTTQAVDLRPGWHCVTAVFTPQRVLCFVNAALLASSPGIDAPLHSIRISATENLWIDDLLVSELHDDHLAVAVDSRDEHDVAVTHSGDEYFGRITHAEPLGMTLHEIAGSAKLELPWSRIATISLHRSEHPVREPSARGTSLRARAESPAGLVAKLDWQPFVDRPQLVADRLRLTILSTSSTELYVAHPWLGEFLIPWRDLRRIEPHFIGHSHLLDARYVHLGDSLRADFHRPRADGTNCQFEFDWNPDLLDTVWLSLDAADLEPSGPETPASSPFLKPLRAERLVTEVILNGQPTGNLNRLIRFKASPHKPDHLCIPLPRPALRPGINTLALKQRPLTEHGSDYDDCELSNLRIEWRARD